MKAVVFVWTEDERVMAQPFEGENCLSRAQAFAEDLRERNDWPGALIVAAGDQEARKERSDQIMESLGGDNG